MKSSDPPVEARTEESEESPQRFTRHTDNKFGVETKQENATHGVFTHETRHYFEANCYDYLNTAAQELVYGAWFQVGFYLGTGVSAGRPRVPGRSLFLVRYQRTSRLPHVRHAVFMRTREQVFTLVTPCVKLFTPCNLSSELTSWQHAGASCVFKRRPMLNPLRKHYGAQSMLT